MGKYHDYPELISVEDQERLIDEINRNEMNFVAANNQQPQPQEAPTPVVLPTSSYYDEDDSYYSVPESPLGISLESLIGKKKKKKRKKKNSIEKQLNQMVSGNITNMIDDIVVQKITELLGGTDLERDPNVYVEPEDNSYVPAVETPIVSTPVVETPDPVDPDEMEILSYNEKLNEYYVLNKYKVTIDKPIEEFLRALNEFLNDMRKPDYPPNRVPVVEYDTRTKEYVIMINDNVVKYASPTKSLSVVKHELAMFLEQVDHTNVYEKFTNEPVIRPRKSEADTTSDVSNEVSSTPTHTVVDKIIP